MTTVLILCILAASAWLALSALGRLRDGAPSESVDDFNRALSALSGKPATRGRRPVSVRVDTRPSRPPARRR